MRSLIDLVTNRDLLEEKDEIIKEQSHAIDLQKHSLKEKDKILIEQADALEEFQENIDKLYRQLEEFDARVAQFMSERSGVGKKKDNAGKPENAD